MTGIDIVGLIIAFLAIGFYLLDYFLEINWWMSKINLIGGILVLFMILKDYVS